MTMPSVYYVLCDRSGAQLSALANRLIAGGKRVVGTLPLNPDPPDPNNCDMDIRVIPSGATFRISQSLGPGSTGCRLDAGALEMAVPVVAAELAQGADLLVLNKFGKLEAEGRGFCPVIAAALEKGIPVVLGVNRLNLEPLLAWSGGLACELKPGGAGSRDIVLASDDMSADGAAAM